MLRQFSYVNAVNDNATAVHRVHTSDHIEHSGFACAIATDDGYKIALVEVKVNTTERLFLIHRSGVKCFFYANNVKHLFFPLSVFSYASARTVFSSTEWQGI